MVCWWDIPEKKICNQPPEFSLFAKKADFLKKKNPEKSNQDPIVPQLILDPKDFLSFPISSIPFHESVFCLANQALISENLVRKKVNQIVPQRFI